MSDINIKNIELSNLISKLEKDTKDISETIKSINKDIRKLDETNWKSKEKDKLDETLIPYLLNLDNSIDSYLNKPLDVLKKANLKYQNQNEFIKESTDILSEDGFI